MPAVLVVPRWGGSADADWYPWLTRELASQPRTTTAEVVSLRPDPDAPRIAPSVDALVRAIDDAADPVVLVGHSVGCQVVVRCLARRDAAVVAAVLVAGWFTVDEPWPEIQPWIDTPHGLGRVPVPTRVLVSTDDPFTADHATTRAAWQALGADVSVHDAAGHFNAAEEPAVRDAVQLALRAV